MTADPAPALALNAVPVRASALVREWSVPFPLDVPRTLSVHRRGGTDPAYRTDPADAIWRTSLTPEGPATLRVRSRRPAVTGPVVTGPVVTGPVVTGPVVTGPVVTGPVVTGTVVTGTVVTGTVVTGTVVTGEAWGPGAGWLLDSLPAQLGFHDDRAGFTACHPVVSELALRYEGLRVGRSGRVFEALVPAVLEQKVVGREAHRAWRYLLGKFGDPAPGPAPDGMRVFPSPRTWTRIPSWDWHRAGVEGWPGRSSPPRPSPSGWSRGWTSTPPRRTTAWCPCPASAPGPRPRSGSGPWAIRTPSR